MEKEGKNIWLKCLSLIQKQVLPEKFKTLFEPIRAVRFKDDVLTIQVASAYVYEVLEGGQRVWIESLWTSITSI